MKKLKIIASIVSLFSCASVMAQPLVCPFTDYFTISAPAGYTISSLSSDGNLLVNKQDPWHFSASCLDLTSPQSGNAFVTISTDQFDLCTLHIVDGPYEMNPTVTFVNCVGGLKYMGMDHVWGTYTYKLKFTR